jgi:uncharacterized protein YhbP (UPF0306 family)
MTADPLRDEARQLLDRFRTACLATAGAEGLPHAANVQFVADDRLNLYFVSSAESLHARHIARRHQVAVTVYDHGDSDPAAIRGLQLHGLCQQVADDQRSAVWQLYVRRFRFVESAPLLRAAVEAQPFFQVTPTWMRLIDNSRGFGFKIERAFEHTLVDQPSEEDGNEPRR